ncbi:CoA transferase [Sphingomonas sp. NCPPB 2930]
MLNPWLAGCTIAGLPDRAAQGLAPLPRSLRFQAARLGLVLEEAPQASGSRAGGVPALEFDFFAPGAGIVPVRVNGWADGSDAPASEFLVQAASGLMAVHGRSSGGSRALGVDFVSTATAALALQGAMAAALGRLRGASVTRVELSMAGATLLGVGQYIAGATAPEAPERIAPGSQSPVARPPFVSADGIVFELESLDAAPWRGFWAGLGIDAALAAQGWKGFLLRYAKATSPVPADMMRRLASIPYPDIAARCAQAGVAICPVRSMAERSRDADARGLWQNGPWRFAAMAGEPLARPRLPSDALPLSGLKVVESCRRIQGPLAGHLLALMGATVIRIEPPGGDPLRGMPPMVGEVSARFDALNRLKAVREIDIKSVPGREAVLELARDADVFLHNWAPDKAAALGLDDGDLAQVNPRLVYAYAGGWGCELHAPDLPGTDFTAQAYSGVAATIAQAGGTRGGSLFTVLDVLGGIVAAQGVTAALLRRQLRPSRCRVDTSLLGGAALLCERELQVCWEGTEAANVGAAALQMVAPTQDGLLAVECPDDPALRRLAEAIDLPGPTAAQALRDALPAWLATRETGDAERMLAAVGVPTAAVAEELTALSHHPRLACALRPADYVHVESPWRWS